MNAIDAIMDQFVLTWKLLVDRRVPLMPKLIPLGALLYVLSPIDIIPDVFIGLGQLDDIGLFLASIKMLEMLAPPDVVQEHRDRLRRQRSDAAGDVIDSPGYREVPKEKRKRD